MGKRMDQMQAIKAHGLIALHLHKSKLDDECWEYDKGWSDASIAEIVGTSAKGIEGLRLKAFGPFWKKGEPPPKKEAAVAAGLLALRHQYNGLVDWIASNVDEGARQFILKELPFDVE